MSMNSLNCICIYNICVCNVYCICSKIMCNNTIMSCGNVQTKLQTKWPYMIYLQFFSIPHLELEPRTYRLEVCRATIAPAGRLNLQKKTYKELQSQTNLTHKLN